MNVIISEESKVIRERLAEMLLSIGKIEVTQLVNSTRKHCETILKTKPDIIVIGIKMSVEECIDKMNLINKITPDTRVIILSSYPYQQMKEECKQLGIIHFFDKYTEFDKVIDVCKELFYKDKAKKEI
ncbi:MAG: response regulator [Candidatus Marinimicrobia bacterium]|nr:response regulator [Candidatus Neomarinimicrobiota bacterium]MBL7022433.1 response regulator [Candidatus Neomarinimicrobiota bacterium]MBL7108712.1 response regulator [Candidatus Neomarinimicrobiota bacterium]